MMDNLFILLDKWLLPVFIIIIVTFFGIFFRFLVHSRLSKIAKKSKWEGDDIIILSIESQIIFWFFLVGLSLALKDAPIHDMYILYSSDLLYTLLIASITHAAAKFVVGIFNLLSKKHGGGFPTTTIFANIVWITVYIIGLLIILDNLHISIAPMLTALGVGGLAVSLALKDTFSDVFAGLHILLSKKVEPGDFVSLDSGEMGYIQDISWRNTKMLERYNNLINIPNTKLSTAIIKNYDSRDSSFFVKIPVGV